MEFGHHQNQQHLAELKTDSMSSAPPDSNVIDRSAELFGANVQPFGRLESS